MANIPGNNNDNTLDGTVDDDLIEGFGGDDTIRGLAGDDYLNGGNNNDTIEGGEGADIIRGESGSDVLVYETSTSGVTVDLGDLTEVAPGITATVGSGGHAEGDIIRGMDNIVGSSFDDTLSLAADSAINNTFIEGGAGDDVISGSDQVNFLSGGDDADTIIGATDGDVIDGGTGSTAADDANDFDTLDLRGLGPILFSDVTNDFDGNSTSGTITLTNTGATFTFFEIERILVDVGPNTPAVDGDETGGFAQGAVAPITTNVLANASDSDGDPVVLDPTFTPTVTGGSGIVSVGSGGTIIYTPDGSEQVGDVVEITYQVTDGAGGTDTSTVTLTVGAGSNTPPVAADDQSSTAQGVPVTIAPLDNDSDADSDPLEISDLGTPVDENGNPIVGAIVSENSDGTITFTPPEGFIGTAHIPYSVTDGVDETSAEICIDVLVDTDGDGIANVDDLDDDNDGITDIDELAFDVWKFSENNDQVAEFTLGDGANVITGYVDYPTAGSVRPIAEGADTAGLYEQSGAGTYVINFDDPVQTATLSVGNIILGNQVGGFQVTLADGTVLTNVGELQTGTNPLGHGGAAGPNAANNVGTAVTIDGETYIQGNGASHLATDQAEVNVTYDPSNTPGLSPDNGIVSIEFTQTGTGQWEAWAGFKLKASYAGDTDGDGIIDSLDLDSDNDGISDLEESGADTDALDPDGNGTIDGAQFVDDDGDGLADSVEAANGSDQGNTPRDSDDDGIADYLDLDSDNDGISDYIEGQSTTNFVAYSSADSDGDGIIDVADSTTGFGGDFVSPTDTDSDQVSDFVDTDSDGDLIDDIDESGLTALGVSTNGIDDGSGVTFDNQDGAIDQDGLVGLQTGLTNEDRDASDVDFRSLGNTPPVDGDETGSFAQGAQGPIATAVLGNASDADGDPVVIDPSFTPIVVGGTGIVTISGGNIVYTPNGSEQAGDVVEITYQVSDGAGGTDLSTVTLTVDAIPCFVRGTVISTLGGEVLIEDLKVGDRIVTRDNGLQKIRWIGSRTVSGRGKLAPVRIGAGVMGNDADLWLSPNHRVLKHGFAMELHFEAHEVLLAAKHMLETQGVELIELDQVEYFHILFESHEVILSNSIWTESFHPGQEGLKSMDTEALDEIFEIFPELKNSSKPTSNFDLARKVLKSYEAELACVI